MSLIQQKRLYEAEACLWGHGRDFSSNREVVEYLDSIIHSDWFIKRFGWFPQIEVRNMNTTNWAGCADRLNFRIHLKRRTENVVLHELAHLICPSDEHDDEFVSIMLFLIRNAMGFYAWAEFSYNLEKVEYYNAN